MIGYKDDKIFLLSVEEYEKYEKAIPEINTWWWLRSPGDYSDNAAYVHSDGSVSNYGYNVDIDNVAVRPALRISNQESENLKVGERFVKYDFPWIKIDENLAIAEVPIAFRRFDKYLNNYDDSEIRQFVKEWLKGRKEK